MIGLHASQRESLGSLLERSGTTTYVLGVLYFVALIYAGRRYATFHLRNKHFGIPHFFLANILFGILVRCLSFVTLATFALLNVDVATDSSAITPVSSEQLFYEHALAVFFNVGDWVAISTYLLLIVVWVEILQRGKLHLYSSHNIRRGWMIAYLTFNVALYMAQIGLYVAVFTTHNDPQQMLDIIYFVIASLNLLIPFVLLVASITYTVSFAGSPFHSLRAKRDFHRINRLVVGWTIGRVVWASMSIMAAQDNMVQSMANVGDWIFSVVIGTLFVVAELLPFLASMGSDVLGLFHQKNTPQSLDAAYDDDDVKQPGVLSPAEYRAPSYAEFSPHPRRALSAREASISEAGGEANDSLLQAVPKFPESFSSANARSPPPTRSPLNNSQQQLGSPPSRTGRKSRADIPELF